MLYPPHFLLVPQAQGLLLLVEKTFQVTGDPWVSVWDAADNLGWQDGVFTEFDVFCDAISHTVDVSPMWITEHVPVSQLKTVLQSLWAS